MNSIVCEHNLNPKKVNQFSKLGNNVKEYLALKIQRGSPRNFSKKICNIRTLFFKLQTHKINKIRPNK